jgi:hypothetical protein
LGVSAGFTASGLVSAGEGEGEGSAAKPVKQTIVATAIGRIFISV